MDQISKMKPGLLDPGHEIYKKLPTLALWSNLTSAPNIYIEIRKNNVVDAYYYGARIAELSYNDQSEIIEAKCHSRYLYGDKASDDSYVSYIKYLESPSKLNTLKRNALKYYVGEKEDEVTREKRIQGRLRIDNDHIYIDSEFEHQLIPNTKNTIRFDLVAIKDNVIRIIELKRLCDARMLTADVSTNRPEILDQMANYERFIAANESELVQYYTLLAAIRKSLGLSVPVGYDPAKELTINRKPLLLIKNLYSYNKMNGKRYNRIAQIKSLLCDNNIDFELLP